MTATAGAPPRVICFDIEASSLSPKSYPIEVGWAEVLPDGAIRSEALLVCPAPSWVDWSSEAERIHGITRRQLADHGRPIDEVVAALDAAFGSGVAFSDAPDAESRWTNRLYAAAGRKRAWRIGDAIPLLRAIAATEADSSWLSAHLEEPRRHRADADARVLAEAYAELRRRRRAREAANDIGPAGSRGQRP